MAAHMVVFSRLSNVDCYQTELETERKTAVRFFFFLLFFFPSVHVLFLFVCLFVVLFFNSSPLRLGSVPL